MSKPNILYIHSHDIGRYIQPYGYTVPTPNLQKLAEQGVLFRKAFCVQPTCSPSRGALLTGMVPHCNGLTGLAHRGFALNDFGQHIVNTLKGAGYRTLLAGTHHVHHGDPADIGYDEVVREKTGTHEGVAEFLRTRDPSRPFFMAVGYGLTHRKFPPPGPDDDARYCRVPEILPDTPENRADMAGFMTAARKQDGLMGGIFDLLDEAGVADETLVICTTDHGIAMPGMKCHLTDHGTGVMLIVRGPGGFDGGKVVDAMVSHLDVFPTVCEVAGIDPPAWLQGKSLRPLVNGEVEETHEQLIGELNFHAAYEPQRSVRTQRWKYIRRYDDRTRRVLPNVDDSDPKALWVDNGWREEQPVADEALYDLLFDPMERTNRAGEPACAEAMVAMRARLDAWMAETDDPLLAGPVTMPAGARLNHPDDDTCRAPMGRYEHPTG